MNALREAWDSLGRPIYVGARLRENLRALTWASALTALLGLLVLIADLVSGARLVAVADAYDAMRSDRVYRKGLPPEVIRKK